MGVVVFDPATFKVRYPQFASVTDGLLNAFFAEAGLYLSNKSTSPVQDMTRRAMLLNMLTAHIATLNGAGTTDGPAPVGRVSQGAEGSVSASFDFNVAPGSAQWYAQTQYGAAFWQATSALRTMRYICQPTRPR